MSKYNVGDKVTIRQWDDMAKEFGLDGYGYIDIECSRCAFIPKMRPYCGKTVEIRQKCSADMHNKQIFKYRIDGSAFVFTEEMFEPVKDMSNTTIQEWSDEHPEEAPKHEKTLEEDFFEKFPNAQRDPNGIPRANPCDIYGEENVKCSDFDCSSGECWNIPLSEVQKNEQSD